MAVAEPAYSKFARLRPEVSRQDLPSEADPIPPTVFALISDLEGFARLTQRPIFILEWDG
jgi:hypothetical protein